MRRITTIALAIAALAVAVATACGEDLPEQLPPDAVKTAYALHATDAQATAWKTSFSILDTPELYFALDVGSNTPGHHVERLVLTMPSGSAYQVLYVAFAVNVAAAAGEQQAERTSAGWRVWASIPVAGTTIQEFNITGRWSVGASVDSATVANASMTLTLQ
ncbi:MAG TPA: hypothetical protein VND93_24685 [Myxococcales bacterium]|nr:hypothetical protein [Myxococcales bacterium]